MLSKEKKDLLTQQGNLLAKERTMYAEERTFLALVRTVSTVVGLLILVMRILFPEDEYTTLFIFFLIIAGIALILERLYLYHRKKDKFKKLEERLE